MTRKTPRWVIAFLRALERTGKARSAALDAGIDFTTAYARRRAHSDFAAEWESALGRFRVERERARAEEMEGVVADVARGVAHDCPSPGSPSASPPAAGSHRPPDGVLPGAPAEGGGEVVLRPDGAGGARVMKGSPGRWSTKKERGFLAEMAAGGTVRRACAAVELSTTALYRRRLNDPHFAAAWDAALEVGRVRLNGLLIAAANRSFDPDELPIGEEPEMPKVSVSEAIHIARMKGAAADAAAAAGRGAAIEPYDIEEVRQRLEKKMIALRMIDSEGRPISGPICLRCRGSLEADGGRESGFTLDTPADR